mgnify:CR=1 FL=1
MVAIKSPTRIDVRWWQPQFLINKMKKLIASPVTHYRKWGYYSYENAKDVQTQTTTEL